MEGDTRGDIREYWGLRPQYSVISFPGIPLHVKQPIKLLKLFQAGSNNLNSWPVEGVLLLDSKSRRVRGETPLHTCLSSFAFGTLFSQARPLKGPGSQQAILSTSIWYKGAQERPRKQERPLMAKITSSSHPSPHDPCQGRPDRSLIAKISSFSQRSMMPIIAYDHGWATLIVPKGGWGAIWVQ